MTESELEDELIKAINRNDGMFDFSRIFSFLDSGIYTKNAGFVIEVEDGSEFKVTIVKTK